MRYQNQGQVYIVERFCAYRIGSIIKKERIRSSYFVLRKPAIECVPPPPSVLPFKGFWIVEHCSHVVAVLFVHGISIDTEDHIFGMKCIHP